MFRLINNFHISSQMLLNCSILKISKRMKELMLIWMHIKQNVRWLRLPLVRLIFCQVLVIFLFIHCCCWYFFCKNGKIWFFYVEEAIGNLKSWACDYLLAFLKVLLKWTIEVNYFCMGYILWFRTISLTTLYHLVFFLKVLSVLI